MSNETTQENSTPTLTGMAALFDDSDALLEAARKVRDRGYRSWDCHTPFPVHGLDDAMGIKPSPIPIICIAAGLTGVAVALLMQWWMSAVDYPINIGGKELFSWPAFVPITFEMFVLFAALSLTGSIIVFCKLWRWNSPLHINDVMKEVTGHRFAVVLNANDELFDGGEARKLLEETGSQDVRELYSE